MNPGDMVRARSFDDGEHALVIAVDTGWERGTRARSFVPVLLLLDGQLLTCWSDLLEAI